MLILIKIYFVVDNIYKIRLNIIYISDTVTICELFLTLLHYVHYRTIFINLFLLILFGDNFRGNWIYLTFSRKKGVISLIRVIMKITCSLLLQRNIRPLSLWPFNTLEPAQYFAGGKSKWRKWKRFGARRLFLESQADTRVYTGTSTASTFHFRRLDGSFSVRTGVCLVKWANRKEKAKKEQKMVESERRRRRRWCAIKKNKRLKEFKYTLGIKAPYVRKRSSRQSRRSLFAFFHWQFPRRVPTSCPEKYITFKEGTLDGDSLFVVFNCDELSYSSLLFL